MKLFFAPGACSLSPHIALHEAGLSADYEQVDIRGKLRKDGSDYRSINPKGAVPALQLDDGQILTEGAAIVQFIADQKPDAQLAPAAGTVARYRLQEWLSYLGAEVHKSFSPLFNPKANDAIRQYQRDLLAMRFEFLSKALTGKTYLMGDQFTVADGYLFTLLNWTVPTGIDLAQWPVLTAYRERIAARPAVQAAMREEGLIQ